MKVFFLASSFPSYERPMHGVFNYRFVKQMNELGEDVFVAFFRIWRPGRKFINTYNYEGIQVTEAFIPLFPFSNYFFERINNYIIQKLGWRLFYKQLKAANIIHSVYLTSNGLNAGVWARKMKKPHISQAIGSDVNSDLRKYIKKKSLNWIKNIDGIIANSKNLETTLIKSLNNCPPVKTIYRGTAIKSLSNQIQIDNEGVTFLYLGGLQANKSLVFGCNTKGPITLMEAWRLVEDDLFANNATLLFGGPDSDNPLFYEWKNSLKHPEAVKLIGKIAPDDVDTYLQETDITIIPSMEEGMPNFLLESAASKIATIGSDAGGIPEVIVHGETGFVFQKGNLKQLSDLLVHAAKDEKQNKRMGEAAFSRVSDHFNAKDYSKNVIEFYKKIMKKCVA